MTAEASNWAEHAAQEGAAVSADPGESGDAALNAPSAGERTFASPDSDPDQQAAAPRDFLGAGGDPAEGGASDGREFKPRSEPDVGNAAPSNHLTGGGDPVEGKR